ncbi:MAG: ATP-binding cassette subfamily F protein uup [Oceanospirillaceae bacterium]|jgi:ATP-binding cassette subfamily F protein uup
MNYLSAENLGRNVGERWLFQDLTFGILQGEKVALIGANGSGKSSLLDIIGGIVNPDGGVLSIRKDIKMGYLQQNPEFNEEDTVLDTILYGNSERSKATIAYERAMAKDDSDLISKAVEQLSFLDAWDYEASVKQILGKLGLQDTDKKIKELSGGQQKRVALARVLLEEPDFLILDEPTNHLDLESIEWLEGYLSTANMTLFLVTHDRYFLDKVSNRIMELVNNSIHKYTGSYAYFLEKKAERMENENATLEKDKKRLKSELEWMRRQPKARTTKAQSRIDAFHDLKERASVNTRVDKVELATKSERIGKKIIEIQHVSKSFNGQKLISEFNYTFKRGDKIAIVGKNGVGKSTLLDMITGQLKPDMGKVVVGETINLGYYQQSGLDFNEGQKVIEVVREIAEFVKLADGRELSASGFLTMFLFPPKVQYNYVHKLSGGEKRRLQLLKILMKSPNFLILDEPTNDLDIDTLNILEEYLQAFAGCLLVVSHDRYFVDNIVDHVFAFEGEGQIKDFPGNYTEYRLWKDEQLKIEQDNQSKKTVVKEEVIVQKAVEPSDKKKLSYKEQREHESLEREIPETEAKIKEIGRLMNGEVTDYEELIKLGDDLEKLKDSLDEKELRWLELSEMA